MGLAGSEIELSSRSFAPRRTGEATGIRTTQKNRLGDATLMAGHDSRRAGPSHAECVGTEARRVWTPNATCKDVTLLPIGHPEAGDRSAIIYTILENCKRQGINPREYLHDVLSRLPAMTNQQTQSLTPANWLAGRVQSRAA